MRLLILALVLCGCGGNGDSGDGGHDGADGADNDGADEVTTPFRLVIADGAQACSQFFDQRTIVQELALRGLLTFRAQTVDLPRNVDSFDADLIEAVQFGGPAPQAAIADGPGTITRVREDKLWGWCQHYTFRQGYHVGARPLVIQGKFSFCKKNGVADPEQLDFDSDLVGEPPKGLADPARVEILGLVDAGELLSERQFYRSCTYQTLDRYRVTAQLDATDQIVVHKRFMDPLMASGPVGLIDATVTIAGQSRAVADYFHMAYGSDQHNFNERYLIVLDSPIGSIHGVHFQESGVPTVVDLLGASLDPANPMEQRTVASYSDVKL